MFTSQRRLAALRWIAGILVTAAFAAQVKALPPRNELNRLLDQRIRQFRALISPGTPPADVRRFNELIRLLSKAQQPFSYTATARLGGESCQDYTLEPQSPIERDTIVTCHHIVIPARSSIRIIKGSSLFLVADVIEVAGPASINGDGQEGRRGDPGGSVAGTWTSQGDGDFKGALSDCRNNPVHKDRGKKGKNGGDGENGATIIMLVEPKNREKLTVSFKGGAPGPGGPGGNGMLYRNGRNFYCDGCTMNCPSGDQGDPGGRGLEGDWIILQ